MEGINAEIWVNENVHVIEFHAVTLNDFFYIENIKKIYMYKS